MGSFAGKEGRAALCALLVAFLSGNCSTVQMHLGGMKTLRQTARSLSFSIKKCVLEHIMIFELSYASASNTFQVRIVASWYTFHLH